MDLPDWLTNMSLYHYLAIGSGLLLVVALLLYFTPVSRLRLKGNSISWYEENAEGMMLLRCLVLSNRWDDTFVQISASLASNRRMDWTFRSPDMPAQLKAKITIEPPKPQVTATSAPYATSA